MATLMSKEAFEEHGRRLSEGPPATGNSTTISEDTAQAGVLTTTGRNGGWSGPETLPQDRRVFLAQALYEPKTYPDPHPGMVTLTVEPSPVHMVLANLRKHTRQYEVMPFGIPLGPDWRIIAWMDLPQ